MSVFIEGLFAVFMVLWLDRRAVAEGLNRYTGLLPWVCVALLATILATLTHALHF